MTHSTRSGILVALATIAFLVLAAEIVLRVAAPVADPTRSGAQHVNATNPYIRFEYPRGYAAVTEVEPGLPGLEGRHFFTTNQYGFRGDSLAVPKPAREYRVFVVGGSTAECFYLDDADDMSRVAQNELAALAGISRVVKVYNVGLSGTASDDHVAMIAQRLVHLEPDAIVLLAGVNDLRRSIQGFDYLHYASHAPPPVPLYKRVLLSSQIVRRLAYFKRRLDPEPADVLEARTLESDYARKIALQNATPGTDADVLADTTSYRTNLRSIAGIARAHDFDLVFMTHPSSWNSEVDPGVRDFQWMRVYDGVVYREDTMDAALERLNDVMRAVSVEDSIPLCDLARVLPKSREYFYDDCHFNREGARAAGRELAALLATRVLAASAADVSKEDSGERNR
ncbi:MAG TPA: GDSL-type esterase/lipase family protein [Candidatus Krumholzibacteria bacterium]|nr:GDSL-type esterase/lipase family protein [Candidatus Krumholzibacteria bacterium]